MPAPSMATTMNLFDAGIGPIKHIVSASGIVNVAVKLGGANNSGAAGSSGKGALNAAFAILGRDNAVVARPGPVLAMANAGPGTNGSRFFLVYKDSELPPDYTVFGTIDQAGLATLDKVAAAGAVSGGDDGSPATPVTIKSVRLD
jgi:cyclophilin family peptidyl-prolyl cis-trans isomerase